MNKNDKFCMRNLQRFIILLCLFALTNLSWGSEKDNEDDKAERIKVLGACEFATKAEALRSQYPKAAFIFDFHGVLTHRSMPTYLNPEPRGDMVGYLNYLAFQPSNMVAVASAWHSFDQVVNEIRIIGLAQPLNLIGQIQKTTKEINNIAYECYQLGKVASVRKIPIKKDSVGESTSDISKPIYYFQKAFSPIFIYGEDCAFDLLIFIDDSTANGDIFLRDVKRAPYFSKVTKVVIFDIPSIDGFTTIADIIPSTVLPDKFRIKRPVSSGSALSMQRVPSFDEDDDGEKSIVAAALSSRKSRNPLAQSQFIPFDDIDDIDDDEKVASSQLAYIPIAIGNPLEDGELSRSISPFIEPVKSEASLTAQHPVDSIRALNTSAENCRQEEVSATGTKSDGRNQLLSSH